MKAIRAAAQHMKRQVDLRARAIIQHGHER
jgi:hypothetical protein